MRDDRYKGTTLPRPVRKLCRMAEREADRAHPERLRRQAAEALASDADREFVSEFRRRLRQHESAPNLFDAHELAESARTGLEIDVARNIQAGPGVDSADALSDALRRRGERYSGEHKCQLIVDRHPEASIVSEALKRACAEAAPIAARRILDGQPARQINDRVRVDEDLLVRHSDGAWP
jgi:hypothetical protein